MFKDKDEIIRWAGGKNSPFLFVEFEEFNIRGRDVFILMQNRGSAIIHISITVFIKREDQRWHKLTDALTIVGVMERVRADNDEEAIIFEYEKIMSRELVIGKLPYDMLK
jgi:hypothetical protein